MTPAARHLRTSIADAVRRGRAAVGWSLEELAHRAGVSKGMVSLIEAGRVNFTVDRVGRVLSALNVAVDLRVVVPYAEPRQRDAAHARCVAYVQRRLEAAGWLVAREVETAGPGFHGWIDVLAFNPATATLLAIEVKTQIDDVGRIERAAARYGRAAWAAANRLGWRPTVVRSWLLVLATDANEERIAANHEALGQSFPNRSMAMLDNVAIGAGLALIDPRSRRTQWLMRARADGRRTAAPYRSYADFVRRRQPR